MSSDRNPNYTTRAPHVQVSPYNGAAIFTSPLGDVWRAESKAALSRLIADYALSQSCPRCVDAALAAVAVLDAEITRAAN